MFRNHRLLSTVGSAVAVSALLLTSACGGSDDKSSDGSTKTSSAKKDAKLAAMVPAALSKDGKIVVATDPSYAPMEYVDADGETVVGVDPDLGEALGKVLGVKFVFEKSTFDAIIPGLSSGKYELGMSSFTDTVEREEVVDFVTYFKAGTDLMVPTGNPAKLASDDNSLCGKSVGAEKGTIQADSDIPARSKKCEAAGEKALDSKVYPDQNAVNLALSTGRIDAALADSGVAGYMAKESGGKFETVGEPYSTAPYGIAVPKDSGDMTKALQGAIQALIDDGTYADVLKKWASEGGAIETAEINAATS
ncbi:MAG: ABC transporter substrate-binding protein [Aeromicrobium sp.]